jgi:hypothetical protein
LTTVDAAGVTVYSSTGEVVIESLWGSDPDTNDISSLPSGKYTVVITDKGVYDAPVGATGKLLVNSAPVGIALTSATGTNEQQVKFNGHTGIVIEGKDNKEIAFSIARASISDDKLAADVKAKYATNEKVDALTTDDIAVGTEVWVFNCGDSKTVI